MNIDAIEDSPATIVQESNTLPKSDSLKISGVYFLALEDGDYYTDSFQINEPGSSSYTDTTAHINIYSSNNDSIIDANATVDFAVTVINDPFKYTRTLTLEYSDGLFDDADGMALYKV